MTDGGRDHDEGDDSESLRFQTGTPSEDPFVWGPEPENAEERERGGDGTDETGQSDWTAAVDDHESSEPADELSPPNQSEEEQSDPDEREQSDPAQEGQLDSHGGELPHPLEGEQPDSQKGELPDQLEAIQRGVGRLEDIAEQLSLAAINANLQRARDDPEHLETVHEDIDAYAGNLEAEVERLSERVADVCDTFERAELDERGRHHDVQPWTAMADASLHVRPPRRSRGSPIDPSRRAGADSGLALGGDVGSDDSATVPHNAPPAPVEFLIPGVKLRDMWRVSRNGTRSGDGAVGRPNGERWILETTPVDVEENTDPADAPEFPREVREFTLAPDEISFDELVGEGYGDDDVGDEDVGTDEIGDDDFVDGDSSGNDSRDDDSRDDAV